MTDRRFRSGWYIAPTLIAGIVGIIFLATCARAATGGADTPIFQCFDLPPLSENGVGQLGYPSAISSDFVAIPGVYAGFTDAFFAGLTPGYVSGGSGRPPAVTPASPALPSVPAPATAVLILSALVAVATLARRKK
jgi:hypothetical protein